MMNDLTIETVEESMRDLARRDFAFFVMRAFRELRDEEFHDNWHIHAIIHSLTRVVNGDDRRLIIAVAPRSLKSFIASVCFPAWILGHNPSEKVVCASYAQPLSRELASETRHLIQTEWYRRVFPGTRLDPTKKGLDLLATTRGGQRRATSVGGSLTGLGGNYVIIDDPMKASDAHSEAERENVMKWYRSTLASRLNDPKKGRIIVIAQRLHAQDLPGQLLSMKGWKLLELPLVEWKAQRRVWVNSESPILRPAGNVLHEERIGAEEIARLRTEMGERDFEAQYNQRPMPPGGALFKLEWLRRYDDLPQNHQIQARVQSWDTAYGISGTNDYSVCSTWAVCGIDFYLLDIYRDRLQFHDLEKAVYRQRRQWKADLVIVERAGSGISLYQNITRDPSVKWLDVKDPIGSKEDRASQQSPKFERHQIWVPNQAPWLQLFEDELASFPHGRHDDQVDSVVQFLASYDTGNLLRRVNRARRL